MKTDPNDTVNPFDFNRETQGGLTKREYFAALAMQGVLSNNSPEYNLTFEQTAQNAVAFADALIKELNK